MEGLLMRSLRLLGTTLAVAILAAVGLAACGGDDDDSGSSTSTPTAPEDRRASDADVADGLHKIDGVVTDAAAALESDPGRAKDLEEQIEPTWEEIEGTIKANDQDTYLTFEDSFALLGNAIDDKDTTKADKAATDVSATVSSYLAAHPG
jgi:hypothetical protein